MSFHISQSLIDKYSVGPPSTKVQQAKNLHEAITKALGSDYETFLQGSYRNHTGLPELNDVDVVALRKELRMEPGGPWLYAKGYVEWKDVFMDVVKRLLTDSRFRDLELGDKCIKVPAMGFRADVVPAATMNDVDNDPIAIYSFREQAPRTNWPRSHWRRGVLKQSSTGDAYKPTVRMFKRWAKNRFAGTKTAPSYYVECAVFNVPDEHFNDYLPLAFAGVGAHICTLSSVKSIGGSKELLSTSEWDPAAWSRFTTALIADVQVVLQAIGADNHLTADRLWKQAFGD